CGHGGGRLSGVTGTAGFLPGESADPVTAQEIMTLRCILAPPTRGLTRSTTRNSRRGRGASRVRSQGHALDTVKKGAAACLALCAALSPDPVLGTNLSGHRGVL